MTDRRRTCKTGIKYNCTIKEEDCLKCKAYEYEPNDLICGMTFEEIQRLQHKKAR